MASEQELLLFATFITYADDIQAQNVRDALGSQLEWVLADSRWLELFQQDEAMYLEFREMALQWSEARGKGKGKSSKGGKDSSKGGKDSGKGGKDSSKGGKDSSKGGKDGMSSMLDLWLVALNMQRHGPPIPVEGLEGHAVTYAVAPHPDPINWQSLQLSRLCQRCGAPSRKKCSVCGERYCSVECQREAWTVHSFVCRPNRFSRVPAGGLDGP